MPAAAIRRAATAAAGAGEAGGLDGPATAEDILLGLDEGKGEEEEEELEQVRRERPAWIGRDAPAARAEFEALQAEAGRQLLQGGRSLPPDRRPTHPPP